MNPQLKHTLSRRTFLATTGAAVMSVHRTPAADSARTASIIGFIKPFQKLLPEQVADIARDLAWSGIELPVRKGGTIEPERAEDELPKYAGQLRKAGSELVIIATDVEDPNDPLARKVLKVARALGIAQYRTKHSRYDLNKAIAPQFDRLRGMMRDLAALNKEIGIQGAIQNHSGAHYVGAPVWDIAQMLREIDSKHLGIYFDIAHATIEGGLSWPLEAKLVEPNLVTVSVKDFLWLKKERGWDAEWCPLGNGMINPAFFRRLSNFSAPVSMHFEYDLGAGPEMIRNLKRDTATLRTWLG